MDRSDHYEEFAQILGGMILSQDSCTETVILQDEINPFISALRERGIW